MLSPQEAQGTNREYRFKRKWKLFWIVQSCKCQIVPAVGRAYLYEEPGRGVCLSNFQHHE